MKHTYVKLYHLIFGAKMRYPNFTKTHNSLMSKHLSREIFEKLKDAKTKNGFTIHHAINSGIKNPDSGVGIYAGDMESYELFAPLFNPIIQEYHNFTCKDFHKSNLDINSLHVNNSDPQNEYIISTRIRVGRNLEGFPLGPAISKEQRSKIETTVKDALNSLTCKGQYYSLESMSEDERNELIKNHFLFKEGDRFLKGAGLNRDWPSGRGIYHNVEKTFLVWVNEEDQLRIISMQQGGDIKEVFSRLVHYVGELEKKMQFSYSEHLGFITSCPTNLGTAMRASVHIKLQKLGANKQKFQEITDKYHLQIRGIHGEHSQSQEGIFDISNKRRLGITEVQCVQEMSDGIQALIECEKNLYM